MDEVWPNWPADYDFAYHNAAHPDLVCPRHLAPGDRVTLHNLVPGHERLTVAIPDLRPVAGMVRADGRARRQAMALDTLFLDVAGPRAEARAYLTWRTTFVPDRYRTAVLIESRDLDRVTRALEPAA